MDNSTGFALDPTTLLFSIGMLGIMMAGISFTTARGNPHIKLGLNAWGLAMLCTGVACMLLAWRGNGPWFLTFFVGNSLIVLFPAATVQAFSELLERTPPIRWMVAGVVIGWTGISYSYFFNEPTRYAVLSIGIGCSMLLGTSGYMIVRSMTRESAPVSWIAACLFIAVALALAIRSVVVLFGNSSTVQLQASTKTQSTFLVISALCVVGITMAFSIMVQNRLRLEALANARRDGLTGLYNRAAFFEIAGQIDATREPETELYAVIMIDIDHFKVVNDTYGHSGGDTVLAHAARLIANNARITDVAGRYGGEEFCVVLRKCNETDASKWAQRLVSEASQQSVRLRDGKMSSFTVSAGYAYRGTVPPDHVDFESISDVIERADQALYAAKRSGRNRACGANQPIAASRRLIEPGGIGSDLGSDVTV